MKRSMARARGRHLVGRHAAAGVEQDAEADRHALVAEVRDFLPLAVLEDGEVVLAQAGHEAAVVVGDRGRDVDQLDAALEAEPSCASVPAPSDGRDAAAASDEREQRAGRVSASSSHRVSVRLQRRLFGAAIDVAHDARVGAEADADSGRRRGTFGNRHHERRLVARLEPLKSSGARPLATNAAAASKAKTTAVIGWPASRAPGCGRGP